MKLIRITDMLKTMQLRGEDREPIPFCITFVTCNLEKCGEKITIKEAIVAKMKRKIQTISPQLHPKHSIDKQ